MKILNKKQWEEMNQKLVDLQLDLKDAREQGKILQEQVDYLQNKLNVEMTTNCELSKLIDKQEVKLKSKTNDIRKLKTYLTQNNIDYDVILKKKEK